MKKENVFILCANRHPTPEFVSRCIFPNEVDPTDLERLEKLSTNAVKGKSHVYVIATGLTMAVVALINACRKKKCALTLMHYNKETGMYYPQHVNTLSLASDIMSKFGDIPLRFTKNGTYEWVTEAKVTHEYDPISGAFRHKAYKYQQPWLDKDGDEVADLKKLRELVNPFEHYVGKVETGRPR